MTLFFSDKIDHKHIFLDGDELIHCVKSLRRKSGDLISVIDGKGQLYSCRILSLDKKELKAEIVDTQQFERKSFLQIAIAPTKNPSRIETFVEKATEIGVHSIHFINYQYGERPRIKLDRLKRIAISALKQSKQYHLPHLYELSSLSACFEKNLPVIKCFGDLGPEKPTFSQYIKGESELIVFIGPEGHFHKTELDLFAENQVQAVSLGDTTLRVETAGIVTAAIYSSR